MGGIGSGRRGPRPGARPCVEGFPSLSAKAAAMAVEADPHRGEVAVRGVSSGLSTTLHAVPCRFGGVRWWWACPDCGGRRAYLYLQAGRWSCRECLGLTYQSCQDSRRNERLIRGFLALAPKWTPSLARRMYDLPQWVPDGRGGHRRNGQNGRRFVDHRGRKWGRKRYLKLIHDAMAAGVVRLSRRDIEDILRD